MSAFENLEVPFLTRGNHHYLTPLQTETMPWIKQFIAAFPACFEYVHTLDAWMYYPEGDAPKHDLTKLAP